MQSICSVQRSMAWISVHTSSRVAIHRIQPFQSRCFSHATRPLLFKSTPGFHFRPTSFLQLKTTACLQFKPNPPKLNMWDHVRREFDNFTRDLEVLTMKIRNGSTDVNSVDAVIVANVASFVLTSIVPPLQHLFLVNGFSNPFPFLLSGLCTMDLGSLIINVLLLYLVTRPLAAGAPPKTFAALWLGATIAGSCLVAAGPNIYMGPLAGMSAIWMFYTMRNPHDPIRLLFLPQTFELRYVMMGLTALYFLQMTAGNTAGAVYIGGAVWGVVFHYLTKNRILKL